MFSCDRETLCPSQTTGFWWSNFIFYNSHREEQNVQWRKWHLRPSTRWLQKRGLALCESVLSSDIFLKCSFNLPCGNRISNWYIKNENNYKLGKGQLTTENLHLYCLLTYFTDVYPCIIEISTHCSEIVNTSDFYA